MKKCCINSIPIPKRVLIKRLALIAMRCSRRKVNCLDIPTIIRKQSTQNMKACAKESKERSSQMEIVAGREVEGSSVVSRITAAQIIVNRL